MKTFFIDTNVLLQCRELKELSWYELAGVEDVLVLISRPVQEEIDYLKHGGNARRARRARKATTLIRELILAEPSIVVLNESSPRVEVGCLTPAFRLETPPCRLLDLSRIDDQIIAEALQYRNNHPNEAVALLTHDTQPLGTAKSCGLPAVVVPGFGNYNWPISGTLFWPTLTN